MNELQVIEVKGQTVLTTKQIAMEYGVAEKLIRKNFENNKSHYELGKHYIYLIGEDLQTFLHTQNLRLQNQNKVRKLYLWTEKGALLHAKSLNTDKAWEVYDYLVDNYFRAKELIGQQCSNVEEAKRQQSSTGKNEIIPVNTKMEKLPEGLPDKKRTKRNIVIPEMNHPMMILHTLLDMAEKMDIHVRVVNFKSMRSMLKDDHIGIRNALPFNEIVYELAYEIAHYMIHYNNGDMIKSPLMEEYNAQAERAAVMLIEAMNIKVAKL